MKISRRNLLKSASAGAAASLLPPRLQESAPTQKSSSNSQLPAAFSKLLPIEDRIHPITVDEFKARVIQAQKLMTDSKPPLAALYLTGGSSLYYFTGLRWGLSERLAAVVIPRSGDLLAVCPAFEEGRFRESLRWPVEVRTWQEDESPYAVIAQWFADRGIRTGAVGIEETTKYVFFDGLRQAAHGLTYASGDPITHICRSRKSAHELELMRLACSATFDVYRAVFASLQAGMTQFDVARLVSQGFERMGLEGGALVLFGEWAARPHGTRQPQKLEEGQVVLIDGGTSVDGYQSDVTRCSVIGKPPDKLLKSFDILRRAQDAALAAAVAGHECGSVDDAARGIVVDAGFGLGYKYFTHRLGHGIGLDGHEWPYLVRGSKIIMQPGMTFSNEPGIYIPGDYGLRLEDDMVISDSGPAQLLTPGFCPFLETPIA
ncbi:MAG: M24 family metallopeptidase [Candidatus Acidiferrales bacterium]